MCLTLWKPACELLVTFALCVPVSQTTTRPAKVRLVPKVDQVGAGELSARCRRGLVARNCKYVISHYCAATPILAHLGLPNYQNDCAPCCAAGNQHCAGRAALRRNQSPQTPGQRVLYTVYTVKPTGELRFCAIKIQLTGLEKLIEYCLHTSTDQPSIMNSKLTTSQQRTICSQLGRVKLQLLYKASIHGFTGAAFHQRCDTWSPTVSVGYNSSGYVFGGYTKQPFSQSGQYVADDQAFLFTFSGEKLLKYPTTNPEYAVRMIANSGPYFGEALALVSGSQKVVYNNPGNYYNFDAGQMHGNDLNLIECEVYQVEESTELERPWRTICWESEKRAELMESIKSYKPTVSSVSQARVLLIGSIGAGKSSFFNSINSVFRGHVTSQAIAGSSATSLTTQFRSYSVKAGRGGKPLPIILCDTMGLEESTGAGLDIDDITSILKGHLPDRYQFNPSAPLHSESHSYRRSAGLKDKIHCVAYVIDACKVPIMPTKLEEKLDVVRRKVNLMGIPQLVLLTKVDEACPLVTEDVRNVYKSDYIKEMMQEVSARLGVPLSCVVPVKNYSEELELDPNCDILLLSAIIQMLRFADNYFDDEITDEVSNTGVKE